MPTKIALKKTTPAPVLVEPRLRKKAAFAPNLWYAASDELTPNRRDSTNTPDQQHPHPHNNNASGRSGSVRRASLRRTFRSSFLREWSARQAEEEEEEEEERMMALATDDIRASPRLLGYLFIMIAGSVMLISVVFFYRERIGISEGDEVARNPSDVDEYFYYTGGVVYRWKLWGAIYCSSAGVGLALLTVLVHFDTVVAPNLWVSLFRDGSLAERNWIFFLILFWAASVHVCTSTLSVGESQPNVYFTTWIAFAASAINYGIWRESAGLPSLSDKVTTQFDGRRETTYNWMWTGFFSSIFAGAATDMYYNRDEIDIRYEGEPVTLKDKDWLIVLIVVWAEVVLCAAAILFNEASPSSCRLPSCAVQRPSGLYRCVFGWRHLEGFILVIDTGTKFWVILKYAAVDGVIPGLSNAYYGVWGSFLNNVFCLGTWLRENKHIEYVARDVNNEPSNRRHSTQDEQD